MSLWPKIDAIIWFKYNHDRSGKKLISWSKYPRFESLDEFVSSQQMVEHDPKTKSYFQKLWENKIPDQRSAF